MSILAPDYLTTGKMTRAGLICMFTIFLLAVGCQSGKTPPGVLNKTEYAEYLVNVYVAEAKLNSMAITPDSAMRLFLPFEQSLIQKFQTTDSSIRETYRYYLAHPNDMEQVITAVIDTLNLREQKASAQSK